MPEKPSSTQSRRDTDVPVGLPALFANQSFARLLTWTFHKLWAERRLGAGLSASAGPKPVTDRRSTLLPIRVVREISKLVRLRGCWRTWTQAATGGSIRFEKYRVAPRLGTDTVRQRLLFRLHQHTPFSATETGLA